ncbi:MAG: SUMF1/EgtB/PvdO family nonheme iron enzyme [Myxococcota bacterium]
MASFAIDNVEVYVARYEACVRAGACTDEGLDGRATRAGTPAQLGEHCNWGKEGRSTHPINCVSWHQATAYCAFREARLPTEAEWERAARGTDARRFPWGHEVPVDRKANLLDRTAYRKHGWKAGNILYSDLRPTTGPVGEIPAGKSPVGALDMVGNVWEWTAPEAESPSDRRVFRGASFMEPPKSARVTSRSIESADHRGAYLGFRCAKSL